MKHQDIGVTRIIEENLLIKKSVILIHNKFRNKNDEHTLIA